MAVELIDDVIKLRVPWRGCSRPPIFGRRAYPVIERCRWEPGGEQVGAGMATELIDYDDEDRARLRAIAASVRATAAVIARRAEDGARQLEQLAADSERGPIEANRVKSNQFGSTLTFIKKLRDVVHGGPAITTGGPRW